MESVLILFIFYLIPSMVAGARKHPSAAAILALNILLGWTMLGWVIALIWSLTTPVNMPIKPQAS